MNKENLELLNKYAINLNERARTGKLDPVIGRDDEIRRVLQILSRRTKNNPILVGEPGVGKTAISEGIAQRIINGDVPENLKSKDHAQEFIYRRLQQRSCVGAQRISSGLWFKCDRINGRLLWWDRQTAGVLYRCRAPAGVFSAGQL